MNPYKNSYRFSNVCGNSIGTPARILTGIVNLNTINWLVSEFCILLCSSTSQNLFFADFGSQNGSLNVFMSLLFTCLKPSFFGSPFRCLFWCAQDASKAAFGCLRAASGQVLGCPGSAIGDRFCMYFGFLGENVCMFWICSHPLL